MGVNTFLGRRYLESFGFKARAERVMYAIWMELVNYLTKQFIVLKKPFRLRFCR